VSLARAIDLASRIRRDPQTYFAAAEQEGSGVLMSLSTGMYFALNSSGILIWEALRHETTLAAILEHLQTRWPEADVSELQSVLMSFLTAMAEKGLVIISG
jgi:hypothetical protein